MPKFETPEPISVTIEIGVGDVRITAGDRADTVIEVHPSDETSTYDVKAAAQVRADYANGALQVTGPRAPRFIGPSRKSGCVDVSIELPSGSHVSADAQIGGFRGSGRLGECRVKTGVGDAWLERTGPLNLRSGFGRITVGGVAGDAEISTSGGNIQVGEIEGTAAVKTANGGISIDEVAGDVRVRTANGDISVGRAGADVDAKTSNGAIRLDEVTRGSVQLGTAAGGLEIGIARGTAAWLEVNTGHGRVRNELTDATQPAESDETVEVRGRTGYGDITIRRAGGNGGYENEGTTR